MNFLSAAVKIIVDDTKLPAQLAKVKSAVTRTVSAIKAAFSKIATSFKAVFDKVVKYAKWGALAVAGALTLATRAAMKQEDAQFLLAAALKISGEWTLKLQHRFEAFAASIQQATIYGDEETLALMQLQKSLGVTSDKLEEAAKMSIGLATATGRDVKSMAMYIALAQQGEFTMLRRYIPALRTTTDATEQLRIITEFAAAGFKLAEERAKTTSGGLRQMWNALGDVAEIIGKALLPGIQKTAKAIKEWAERNQKRIGEWAEVVAEKIGMVIDNIWNLVNVLTTDFSKGMGIVKDIVITAMVAIVDTFLIGGIAAGKAFWKGIGFGGPSAEDVRKEYEKLGGPAEYRFKGFKGPRFDPDIMQQAERNVTIRQLKEEVGVVEQLKEVWKQAGQAMSVAIPSAKPALVAVGVIGAHEAYAKSLEPSVEPTVPPKPFEFQPQEKPAGMFTEEDYTEAMAIANRWNDYQIKTAEEANQAMADSASEFLSTLTEQHDMTRLEKISAIEEEMELKRTAWSEESDAMKALEAQRNRLQQLQLEGWSAIKMSMFEFYESSMNWGARLGEILSNAFASMGSVMIDALTGGEDVWKNFAKMVVKQLLVMIATLMIAVALQTIFTFGANVTIGMPAISSLFSSLAAMSKVEGSKQTGGDIYKTGLYKLHEGEKVLTKSEMSSGDNSGMNLTIINNVSDKVGIEVDEDPDERTVNVVVSALATYGPLRRAVSSIRS